MLFVCIHVFTLIQGFTDKAMKYSVLKVQYAIFSGYLTEIAFIHEGFVRETSVNLVNKMLLRGRNSF